MAEQTKFQTLILPAYDGTLSKASGYTSWYQTVRDMRNDATIALARDLVIAPMLAADWSYESSDNAPVGATDWLIEVLTQHRHHLLRTTIEGWLDFGWQPYETVIDFEDGTTNLRKIKPLLQDITEIMVNDFGAIKELHQYNPDKMVLDIESSLITYTNVEGTNWYGRAIMAPAEIPYCKWNDNLERLDRYDTRVSGAHWLLRYPVGVTQEYNGQTDVDNFLIATEILQSIGNNSKIALPLTTDEMLTQLNGTSGTTNAWTLELITDSGGASSAFMERFRYWDTLKVRALRLPERSVLEGQFGTKAEAEAHADFAILVMEQRHQEAVLLYNWYLVNRLLRYQYGEAAENTVYIVPAPLSDTSRAMLKNIYTMLLSSPNGIMELDRIDYNAITDKLGIPTITDDVQEEFTESDTLPEDSSTVV